MEHPTTLIEFMQLYPIEEASRQTMCVPVDESRDERGGPSESQRRLWAAVGPPGGVISKGSCERGTGVTA